MTTDQLKRLKRIGFYLGVVFMLAFILVPFYWQVSTSLKPPERMFISPPDFFPSRLYLGNYQAVFTTYPFTSYILNSAIVAGSTTLFSLFVGSFAAYALARLSFPGKHLILAMVLAISMFPGIAIISPLYLLFRNVGLLDTRLALILPYTTFTLPLALWNLTTFFREIPFSLEEAAKVDGATPLQAFLVIILPLAAPGMFTTAILVFIFAWNEFLFALTLTTSVSMRTVPVGIAFMPGEYLIPWGDIAAASVIVTLPLIGLVLAFQRRIVAGLTAGAVKG